ncbi:helicase associated domain-containing protein, partial [Streptomyces sp. NPDC006510]|uniref:helicase associated domain-containing protein n=1 Tax=Streptomyces sp. NPDC006510 TaxID=3155600 RepID=UPI0033A734F8
MPPGDAYKALSKVLGALRAHDTDTIEALADFRVRSGREDTDDEDQEHDGEDVLEDGDGDVVVSRAAAGVLRFSEVRGPAVLAQFVRLRVIDPEGAYWRRGIEAAGRWLRETGNTVLRVPYTAVTPEDWGGIGGYPLGQWIADQRRAYTAGTLEAGRVAELEQLGMVWSEQEAAWADGVAVAEEYAAVHGHFLPPTQAPDSPAPTGCNSSSSSTDVPGEASRARKTPAAKAGADLRGEVLLTLAQLRLATPRQFKALLLPHQQDTDHVRRALRNLLDESPALVGRTHRAQQSYWYCTPAGLA